MYAMTQKHWLYAIQTLETLVAHAERWHAAYITANLLGLSESLNKGKGRFGQLRTLQVRIPSGASCCHHNVSNFFEDAPNLTRVRVLDHYRLRLSSLTVLHFKLARCSAHRFFAELEQMTSLEELVVGGGRHDLPNVPVSKLPSLKTYSVDCCVPLTVVKAPSLEKLYLADGLLDADTQTVETFLRGVNHIIS